MSNCPGCFPRFQENQMAHNEPGGCLYVEEEVDEISMISETSIHYLTPSEDDTPDCEAMQVINIGEEQKASVEAVECCICFENIGTKNNCVTECGHKFCFKCLAMAMTRSNACPCCRQPLVDEVEVAEDNEEGESDYEEEDDDDDADDFSDDEENDSDAPIETIVERFEKEGLTMLDVVSMMLGRFSKVDEKYTNDHINILFEKCDRIIEDARKEAEESCLFAQEDH